MLDPSVELYKSALLADSLGRSCFRRTLVLLSTLAALTGSFVAIAAERPVTASPADTAATTGVAAEKRDDEPAEIPPSARPADLSDAHNSPLLNRRYRWDRPTGSHLRPKPPSLEAFEQRFRIVHATHPHVGMRVVGMGPDIAPFSMLFGRAVAPEGRVIVLGTGEDFESQISALASAYRVEGIVTAQEPRTNGTGLEAGSVDLAFLADAYPQIDNPKQLLDSLYQALVPYGSLVVLEPRHELDPTAPADRRKRKTRERIVAEIEHAGFRAVDAPDFLMDHDFLRFEKIGDEPDLEVGPIRTDPESPTPDESSGGPATGSGHSKLPP